MRRNVAFEKKGFSGKIIAKMLGNDDQKIKEWYDEYKNNYSNGYREGYREMQITPEFREMAEEYFRGFTPIPQLMNDYGIKTLNRFWKILAYVGEEKN